MCDVPMYFVAGNEIPALEVAGRLLVCAWECFMFHALLYCFTSSMYRFDVKRLP